MTRNLWHRLRRHPLVLGGIAVALLARVVFWVITDRAFEDAEQVVRAREVLRDGVEDDRIELVLREPIDALALMAIGMTRLSMGPPSIGPIKEMVRSLDLTPIKASVAAALSEGNDGVGVRELLLDWVNQQGVPI